MKTITEYIQRKHIKEDVPPYHLSANGISNETFKKCEENTYKYLKQKFNITSSNKLVTYFVEHYQEYLEAEGDADPIDIARDIEWLNDKYKRIKKIGAPAFIDHVIPQGWYHYINWKYENNL